MINIYFSRITIHFRKLCYNIIIIQVRILIANWNTIYYRQCNKMMQFNCITISSQLFVHINFLQLFKIISFLLLTSIWYPIEWTWSHLKQLINLMKILKQLICYNTFLKIVQNISWYLIVNDNYHINVESAAGLEGVGDELAVEAVFVSSTSIIVHADFRIRGWNCARCCNRTNGFVYGFVV